MKCELCGRNGSQDPLDLHHVFFGTGLRKLSDRYGATCYLCHNRCHIFGPDAVHVNKNNARMLQAKYQVQIMQDQGWNIEEWIQKFGRDYT